MTETLTFHDRVSIDIADHIADVRLTRGDKMNALDPDMFKGIIEAGAALQERSDVRAVILSGEGRSFCAGLDMASFTASPDEGAPTRLTDRTYGDSNKFQQVAMQWRKLPMPVIAAVHGVCFGGGVQIMSGADIRIITPDARLSVMEMRWGLIPDMAGYALWREYVRGDVIRELTYTNREFSGEDALAYGFATYNDVDPHSRATAIAREIANRNPDAVRAAKNLFNRTADMNSDDILMAESELQQDIIRSPNQMEAVMAFMQKRAANFSD